MRTALLTLAALAASTPALAQKAVGNKNAGPTVRLSTVMGADVAAKGGEVLGTAEDVILNDRNGRMQYLIAKMTEGGKLHAVPFEKITVKTDAGKTTLMVDAEAASMKDADGFAADSYPDFTQAEVRKGIDDAFGIDHKGNAARGKKGRGDGAGADAAAETGQTKKDRQAEYSKMKAAMEEAAAEASKRFESGDDPAAGKSNPKSDD